MKPKTDKFRAVLEAGVAAGKTEHDTVVHGLRARGWPSGRISLIYRYRHNGKTRDAGLGLFGSITLDDARTKARILAAEVSKGNDPLDKKHETERDDKYTVDHVLKEYVKDRTRHKIRSVGEMERTFDRYVPEKIRARSIYDRSLLDVFRELLNDTATAIAARSNGHGNRGDGITTVNRLQSYLRSAFTYWQDNDSQFKSYAVPIPRRKFGKELKRERVLDEQELRDLWAALAEVEGDNPKTRHAACTRMMLLTACRPNEPSGMTADELDTDHLGDYWLIPKSRYKVASIDHVVPMVPVLKALLPPHGDGFVYGADLANWDRFKKQVDRKIAEIRKRDGRKRMPQWQWRDLRRTASTFMNGPVGIEKHIVERVLGHVLPGMQDTYNKWKYRDEKAEAITRWADHLFKHILLPPPGGNVLAMPDSGGPIAPARSARRSVSG